MQTDFELTTKILNGFWYTFEYQSKHILQNKGYDKNPLIFCIRPSEKDINCFVGLNIHHIPSSDRRTFIERLSKLDNFPDDEIRHIYSENQLNTIYPYAYLAFRTYNRKNVINAYRIKNEAVGKYIFTDGDFVLSNPNADAIKFNLSLKSRK